MEQEQLTQLLTAYRTTMDTQQKALDTLILTLNSLAARLEPLASIMEGLIAGFDGTVNRLETITLAQTELAKIQEETLAFIQQVAEQAQEQQEHHL